MRYPDIEQFGKPFTHTEIQHFNLLAQVKTAFRGQLDRHGSLRPWTRRFLRTLEKLDSKVLSIAPWLKKYCGAIVVVFTK